MNRWGRRTPNRQTNWIDSRAITCSNPDEWRISFESIESFNDAQIYSRILLFCFYFFWNPSNSRKVWDFPSSVTVAEFDIAQVHCSVALVWINKRILDFLFRTTNFCGCWPFKRPAQMPTVNSNSNRHSTRQDGFIVSINCSGSARHFIRSTTISVTQFYN